MTVNCNGPAEDLRLERLLEYCMTIGVRVILRPSRQAMGKLGIKKASENIDMFVNSLIRTTLETEKDIWKRSSVSMSRGNLVPFLKSCPSDVSRMYRTLWTKKFSLCVRQFVWSKPSSSWNNVVCGLMYSVLVQHCV